MTAQDALKDLRRILGLTQEQFARQVNLTTRTISRYETDGQISPPALMRFWHVAEENGASDLARFFRQTYLVQLKERDGFTAEFSLDRNGRVRVNDAIADIIRMAQRDEQNPLSAVRTIGALKERLAKGFTLDLEAFRDIVRDLEVLLQDLTAPITVEEGVERLRNIKRVAKNLGRLLERFEFEEAGEER